MSMIDCSECGHDLPGSHEFPGVLCSECPEGRCASKPPRRADVTVENHGSVVLVSCDTGVAVDWVEDNLDLEDWQWLRDYTFVVAPRYLDNLIHGMVEAGLEVA